MCKMHGGTPRDQIIWPQILLKIQVSPRSGSIRDQHLVQEVQPNLFKLSAGQTENQTFEIWSQDLESGQSGPRNLASKATGGELRRRVFEWRPLVVQCSAVQCSSVQCSAVQCSAVQCSAVQCSALGVFCDGLVVFLPLLLSPEVPGQPYKPTQIWKGVIFSTNS